MCGSQIDSIETWACSLPLDSPLDFGSFQVASREYTAVRLRTSDGLVADGLALTRRSPVDVAIADILAPLMVGRDALDRTGRAAELARGTRALDEFGVIGRARSMLEICLWDIAAQADGIPLWRMLGGSPRELDVLLVEGYRVPEESDSEFGERLAERTTEGFRRFKIEGASYRDPRQLAARIEAFRRHAGEEPTLVVDLAWSWADAATGLDAIQHWRPFGLAWVEDPMPRGEVGEIATLRREAGVPIGVGDEATDAGELLDLMAAEALDIVRIDALALGGVAAALGLAAQAQARGLAVSLHEMPELHEHLAFAIPGSDHVEMFPQDRPFVNSHQLLRHTTLERVERGRLRPSQAPGTGIALADEALGRCCYRHQIVRKDATHQHPVQGPATARPGR
jgi:L-alanine-DL-glutamate epimerase-like enolase superfamily enzyme